MGTQKPELVIFDCDGVLVDSEVIASRVLAEAVCQLGGGLTAADCLRRFTGLSIATVVELLKKDGTPVPDDFTQTLRARDKAAFEAELKPIPGINAALERIATKKAVASSGRLEKINHSLALTGLISWFTPHLYSAEMVAHGKPAPDLFLLVAKTMGVAADACVVVEDSPAGIQAAQAAGMTPLGFTGASHAGAGHGQRLLDAGADDVFDNMKNLPGLLNFQADTGSAKE